MSPGYEDSVFRNQKPEDFQPNAARIEAWILNPATMCPHLDTLRDAIEFKKLNNNLLKVSLIEECIGDIYAVIYESNAENLKKEETDEEKRVRMRVDNIFTSNVPDIASSENAVMDARRGDQASVSDPMAIYRRKPTNITHREVIRRAEALTVKPPPIATPKPAAKTLPSMTDPGTSPVIAVVIPTQDNAREVISVPDTPGSVHDSADDESELSDAEDEGEDDANGQEAEEERKSATAPLFPNLFGIQNREVESGTTSDVEIYVERPVERVGNHDPVVGSTQAGKAQETTANVRIFQT